MALARSLQAVGSACPLVVLATSDAGGIDALEAAGCVIRPVSPLPLSEGFRARHSRPSQHALAPFTKGEKPHFHDPLDNFCKLELWRLTAYRRVVFLDADTLAIRNIDKLFGYPEFCAAPNLYESLSDMQRMNSGVFVASPSNATFDAMLAQLDTPGVFWRRTDQTFLERFFPDWHGLPYTYNALQYLYFNMPQIWHWRSIRVIHYQYEKPWQKDHGKSELLKPLIDLWHRVLEGGSIPTDLVDPVDLGARTPH